METAFLVESAQPTVRRGSRAPSFWTWGASLSAVLLVTIVCLLLVRDDRGFATLNASHAVIRASLLEVLSPSKTTKLQDFEATFAQYKNLSHEERAQITQGYMVCCIRDDSDIPPPVYGPAADYYEDWPIDPICIPGYVKVHSPRAEKFSLLARPEDLFLDGCRWERSARSVHVTHTALPRWTW